MRKLIIGMWIGALGILFEMKLSGSIETPWYIIWSPLVIPILFIVTYCALRAAVVRMSEDEFNNK